MVEMTLKMLDADREGAMDDNEPPSPRSPVGQAQITVRAETLLVDWRQGDVEQRLARMERLWAYEIAKRELLAQRADVIADQAQHRRGRHDPSVEDTR